MNTEINVTLEELRRKEDSLQDFQKIVVKNIQEINQTTVKYLINQTDVIMKSLKEQTNSQSICSLSLLFSHLSSFYLKNNVFVTP